MSDFYPIYPEQIEAVLKGLAESNGLDLVLKIDWSTETVALADLEYALAAPSEELVEAVAAHLNGN